jgi:hypothetical protein
MKRTIFLLIILAVIALPQIFKDRTLGQGEFILVNQAGVSLDRSKIEAAAQTLTGERAVDIAIYLVSDGTKMDFDQRLRRDSLVNNVSQLKPRTFTIYIGIDNRYSEIGWGSTLSVVNGSQIRREILNPRLQEGDYTGSIVNALNIAAERFDNPYSFITSLFANIGGFIQDNPEVSLILGALGFLGVARMLGWLPQSSGGSYSGSSYDDDSYLYNDSSSDSIDFGGSDDGGGGFDGGSWDD